MRSTLVATGGVVLLLGSLNAQADVLERALTDEMNRSLTQLRLEDADPPYFVSYTVHHDHTYRVSASFGGVVSQSDQKTRALDAEVRIGDYKLDNTNFSSRNVGPVGSRAFLPIDDDYTAIRNGAWLLTDRKYRNAVDLLAGKTAAMENFTIVDQLPDFNREEPVEYHEEPQYTLPDFDDVAQAVRELSAVSNRQRHIVSSWVSAYVSNHHDFYLNSEGTSFTRVDDFVRLVAVSTARADDGQTIADYVAHQGWTWSDLPPTAQIVEEIAATNSRLKEQQSAATLETVTGPVLLRGQAAAELVVQVMGPFLRASRTAVTDSAQLNRRLSGRTGNPWQDTIGSRVLPRDISIYSDPTLTEYEGVPLLGTLTIDKEGVKPIRVELVRRGLLKTLLTTRTPTTVAQSSSGSRRNTALLGNLIVESRGGLPQDELMEEFKLLIEEREAEFGLVITKVMSPVNANELAGGSMRYGAPIPVISARKVNLDGTEEVLRNVFIAQFHVAKFKDIIATSDSSSVQHVSTTRISASGDFDSDFSGSVVTPDLLIEDVTVVPTKGVIPTMPILNHPVAAGSGD